MAEYNVTSPDGTKYRVTGPDGASDADILGRIEEYKKSQPSKQATLQKQEDTQEPSFLAERGSRSASGAAGFLGTPVDLMNTLISSAAKIGGGQEIKEPVGGSEWFKKLFKEAGLIKPGTEADSLAGKAEELLWGSLPLAAATAPKTIPQAVRAATAAITSSIGGEVGGKVGGAIGEQIGGPAGQAVGETVGSVAGSLAPGGRRMTKSPTAGEKTAKEIKAERFAQAKEKGIPILPRYMKADKANQRVTDAMLKDLGLPPDARPNVKTIEQANKAQYDAGYVPVINEPKLGGIVVPTNAFKNEIDAIEQEEVRRLAFRPRSSPKTQIMAFTSDFRDMINSGRMNITDVMDNIKQLREGASLRLGALNPTDIGRMEGRAMQRMANALEKAIEDNLASVRASPDVIKGFRDARTNIAKGHAYMDAMDPVTQKIIPEKLAAAATAGAPFSGEIKTLAEIGGAFPGAASSPRTPKSEELFTHRTTPSAVTRPEGMVAHLMARTVDPLAKSVPYQSLFVDPKAKLPPDVEKLLRLVIGLREASPDQQ